MNPIMERIMINIQWSPKSRPSTPMMPPMIPPRYQLLLFAKIDEIHTKINPPTLKSIIAKSAKIPSPPSDELVSLAPSTRRLGS